MARCDIERIVNDPNLLKHPQIREAREVFDEFNRVRDTYITSALAESEGDGVLAYILAIAAHESVVTLHEGLHNRIERNEAAYKAAQEQARIDARIAETERWIEELS